MSDSYASALSTRVVIGRCCLSTRNLSILVFYCWLVRYTVREGVFVVLEAELRVRRASMMTRLREQGHGGSFGSQVDAERRRSCAEDSGIAATLEALDIDLHRLSHDSTSAVDCHQSKGRLSRI